MKIDTESAPDVVDVEPEEVADAFLEWFEDECDAKVRWNESGDIKDEEVPWKTVRAAVRKVLTEMIGQNYMVASPKREKPYAPNVMHIWQGDVLMRIELPEGVNQDDVNLEYCRENGYQWAKVPDTRECQPK